MTPLTRLPTGIPYFKMTLDGKPVDVVLHVESDTTFMPLSLARTLFGLEPGSPGMQQVSAPGEAEAHYRYTFKTLGTDALQIRNPAIMISDDKGDERCDAKADLNRGTRSACYGGGFLRLGRNTLRALRIFLSLSEGNAYLTAADAH